MQLSAYVSYSSGYADLDFTLERARSAWSAAFAVDPDDIGFSYVDDGAGLLITAYYCPED